MDIKKLRDKIDDIDREIISLFEERMKISKGISDYKKQNNLPLFDKSREEQVLQSRMSLLKDKSLAPYAKRFVVEMMDLSKAYQYRANTDENIVLIGMMGSGKTEKGKIVAEKLCLDFVDIDEETQKREGMSINDIFAKHGEEYFRSVESAVIEKYAEETGYVISTGGGVVLSQKNMQNLKEKGKVFFLNRNIDDIVSTIDTKNRPLLAGGTQKLYEIYKERLPLYLKWCDFEMTTQGSIEQCAAEIISKLY